MIIEIDIVNKRPAVIGAPVIICGNSGYTIQFTFDEEWANEALKTARFVYTKAGTVGYQDVAFGGNVVPVPVLSDVREVYVGVYAGELQTTTPARIPCERSILCGSGVEYEEPDPDVYSQILEAVNQLIGVAGTHPGDKNNPHGVTAAQIGAAAMKTGTALLLAGGWSNNSQTVNVPGVTTDNNIIPCPAPASYTVYHECSVRCTAQAAGSLTFVCDEVPAEDLTVNVLILT